MKMKKFKKYLNNIVLLLILAVLSFCPILTGCFTLSTTKLDTPNITLHSSSKCITWSSISNAKEYLIYCNDTCVDNISSNGLSSYLYDFSSDLNDEGDYKYYIIATSHYRFVEDSDVSNAVTYTYSRTTLSSPIPQDTSVVTSDDLTINFVVSGTQLTYTPLSNSDITSYEIYLYSQSTGLNVYTLESTSIELQSTTFSLKDEIYAIRLGVVMGDEHIVCSDIKYINPDNYGSYTTNIYMFDGYINDYYIESLPELRNIVYYSFVYRMSEFDVKLSSNFQNNILSTYSGSTKADKLVNAVYNAMLGYMPESRQGYTMGVTLKSLKDNTYTIRINYDDFVNSDGNTECDLKYTPDYVVETYNSTNGTTETKESLDVSYSQADWIPYYENCSYTMRCDDEKYTSKAFDDFVSDKQFLYTPVSSSEELYWAVENKITPIVESGSRAEIIYNKAKEVLNSIISDDMSDYEKTLSIFDWICTNISYDYYSLTNNSYVMHYGDTSTTEDDQEALTLVPIYYLEGVFLTGYAVCDGFSKAFSLLCNMEGIDAIRITGEAVTGGVSGGHAWNKVLLDKDPTDSLPAQYYLVDITWTEYLVSTKGEMTTHAYFLISDGETATTHYPDSAREKFSYYEASNNYDYYDTATFSYNNTTYDLVIESDEELEVLLEYMCVDNIFYTEVVIDYDYMKANYISSNGGSSIGANNNLNLGRAFEDQIKESVFIKCQSISGVYSASFKMMLYNDEGETGLLVIFTQDYLIDELYEQKILVETLDEYDIYGEMEIEVSSAMLKTATGTTDLDRVENLFSVALLASDIDIDFQLITSSSDTSNGSAIFKIIVSEKSN